MLKHNRLVVGLLVAGALTFGMATPASAGDVATHQLTTVIGGTVAAEVETDSQPFAGQLSQSYRTKPWGAGPLADYSLETAAGPLGDITVSEVDYYDKTAGPLGSPSEATVVSVDIYRGASQGYAVTVSSSYVGPLGWGHDFPSATPLIGSSI